MEYRFDETVRYTKTHEWVRVETGDSGKRPPAGAEAVIGISDYAQDKLSDVVFVELPAAGKALEQGKPFTVIESVKAAEDVMAPVSGTVTAVNPKLEKAPELVNKDPFREGWIARVALSDPSQVGSLMDAAGYRRYVEGL